MPFEDRHARQYDLVVFGATGYTGQFTAEHIAENLPTDLRWAIAGRSRDKLERLVDILKKIDPDRRQPDIELCNLADEDLDALSKKTFTLISAVGPFASYGEPAFRACAQNGTHYFDVTGEVPWVFSMIKKYEETAKASGAIMFPQIGLESAPSDLITWSLANLNRTELQADTRDVTVSIHTLNSAPSGGTLATVLTLLDNISLKELRASHVPFALSPIPNPNAAPRSRSLLTKMTGVCTIPNLGLQTTSLAGMTDKAIVERGWGLMSTIPSRRDQFYGPNFSFTQYMGSRSWLSGIATHLGLALLGIVIVTRPLRAFVKRFVHRPGDGPDREEARKDYIEYRGVANPDLDKNIGQQAFCRASFTGSMYYLTAVLASQAALTVLQDDVELEGGIYTPACLGQSFIDRLHRVGFKIESSVISA